jgi:hypothetical protein
LTNSDSSRSDHLPVAYELPNGRIVVKTTPEICIDQEEDLQDGPLDDYPTIYRRCVVRPIRRRRGV